MTHNETFFGKQTMTMYGGGVHFGRTYWVHFTHDVFTGELERMNNKNPDGSIDVLGARVHRFGGCTWGTTNRGGLQKSLAVHADKLKESGATIVKQTKNTLIARYKGEKIMYAIKPTSVYKPLTMTSDETKGKRID